MEEPGQLKRIARVEAAATVLLVSLGLFMRCAGVLFGPTIGFWNDEASWAVRVVDKPLADLLLRPIGFLLTTRWSVALLGNTEFAVRLVPWLAGLATPPIAVLLARRFLKRPAARLLFIGILCLSPIAVDFSKEFKPYGPSLMLHLLLPLLVLRWHETRRTRDLVLFALAAPLAVFFSQDVIFVYPGLFLVLGIDSYRSRNFRQLGLAAGAALLSAGIVLGMYVFIWSRMPRDQSEYWGKKYGVFYRPNEPSDTALVWYANKYAKSAALPGDRRRLFEPKLVSPSQLPLLRQADLYAWVVLHAAGLAVLALQRRFREALLFLSPTLVCAAFNYLGHWPFGPFRTNTFLLAGMSAVAALGLDWKGATKRAWAPLVPVALLVFAPMLLAKNDWGFTKQVVPSSQMPALIEQMLALPETQGIRRQPFFLDHNSFNVFRYYVQHHERSAEWHEPVKTKFVWKYREKLGNVYRAVRRLGPGRSAWVMLAKGEPPAQLRPRLMLEMSGFRLYQVKNPPKKSARLPSAGLTVENTMPNRAASE